MSETSAAHQGPGLYEIRVQGRLASRWAAWFDDFAITHEDDGTSLIRGHVADQSALHGLLRKVRDTGLPLVSVIRITTTPSMHS